MPHVVGVGKTTGASGDADLIARILRRQPSRRIGTWHFHELELLFSGSNNSMFIEIFYFAGSRRFYNRTDALRVSLSLSLQDESISKKSLLAVPSFSDGDAQLFVKRCGWCVTASAEVTK